MNGYESKSFVPVEGVPYPITIRGKQYTAMYSRKIDGYIIEEPKFPVYELIGHAEEPKREKTLSEASYEELAKEMWKRCAENTSLV